MILAALFIIELLAISIWLDGEMLRDGHGLVAVVGNWGATILRAVVALALAFLVFGESKAGRHRIELRDHRVSWTLLACHGFAMALFGAISAMLFGRASSGAAANLEVVAWAAAGLAGIALAACAFVPAKEWTALIRSMWDVLAFAAGAAIVAVVLGLYARAFWMPLVRLTFALVELLLRPVLPGLTATPATSVIGTEKFHVEIAPECSGYEGMGLILTLSTAWIWFLRKEWRFPNALLLIPAGVVTIWILNGIRIAVLILIGSAGAERIALGGFHSQFGWIAFCITSLAICMAARRVAWFTNAGPAPAIAAPLEQARDATAAYLAPFLAIMASGLVARSMTADFEWVYFLRVAAAIGALWAFRRDYESIEWRPGAAAFAIGAGVFALWIGVDRMLGIAASPAPAEFRGASHLAQIAWIVARIIGGVVTVPIAEELAFRGYLLRRISSADFESVDLRRFAWLPFVISSVAFGLLHGERWAAGTIAGMAYAWAAMRRGRIGDAAVAHGFTNALIAVWVLAGGNWQLW
jgi:exosortase E/protease (VPEID-CTERM system)